jgi:hypothetical protein
MINLTSAQLLNPRSYDKYNSKEITVIVDSKELTNFNIHAVYFGHISSKCHTTLKYLNQLDFKAVQFDTTHLLHTIKMENKAVYIYHKGPGFVGDSSDNPPSPPPSPINFPPKFLLPYSPWSRLSYDNETTLCGKSYTFVSPPTLTLDTGWIKLIENREISSNVLKPYDISCTIIGIYASYQFGANVYPIDQQVWLPRDTIIEGSNNPNTDGNPHKSLKDTDHTIFYSVGSISGKFTCIPTQITYWGNYKIWGTHNKCTRQGFLMNNNTIIRNCIIQGGTLGGVVDNGMGLGGGGLIELPGCAAAYRDISNKKHVCGGQFETTTEVSINTLPTFWTGKTGDAVSNVLIENIRANMYANTTGLNYTFFWSSMNIKDHPHKNIFLRKIVSLQTIADGINVHGNVQNFIGEDLYFENVGDDTVAIWGVGGGSSACNTHNNISNGCPAENTVASNIQFKRVFARKSQKLGECYRIIGAKDVSFIDITCCGTFEVEQPILVGITDQYCVKYPKKSTIDISMGRVIYSKNCPISSYSKEGTTECGKGYPNSTFTQTNHNSCENNQLTNLIGSN